MDLKKEYDRILNSLKNRTPISRKLYERACKVLPMGVTYHIRYIEPYPFYVARAKGCKIWDVDGNVYDDYWIGHGALILGHAPTPVLDAVREQLEQGTHFGFAHEKEIELAELITRYVPNVEKIRFTNSGTEANMYAVRLARAFTGRRKIVKMEGGWHGGYDTLHTGVTPPFTGPESAGLPETVLKDTVSVPFNDADALRRVLKEKDVAAVILEPVMGVAGAIPADREYLKEVREICDKTGTLLIFDEVITGFRLAMGGGQEYFGVDADIVVMGKIIGGGFPIGAFGAREEIMKLLDYKKHRGKLERSFHGGTFTGNPISMVAGTATIKELESRHVHLQLNRIGEYMIKSLEKVAEQSKLPIHVTGTGSIIGIHFTRRKPVNARISYLERWNEEVYPLLHKRMLLEGIVYVSEHMAHFFLSISHDKSHVEKLVNVFSKFIDSLERALKSG